MSQDSNVINRLVSHTHRIPTCNISTYIIIKYFEESNIKDNESVHADYKVKKSANLVTGSNLL